MWTELNTNKPIDVYRRNLQRSYVDKLMELASAPSGRETRDVGPIVKQKLEEINQKLSKAGSKSKDEMTLYHLKYMETKITRATSAP